MVKDFDANMHGSFCSDWVHYTCVVPGRSSAGVKDQGNGHKCCDTKIKRKFAMTTSDPPRNKGKSLTCLVASRVICRQETCRQNIRACRGRGGGGVGGGGGRTGEGRVGRCMLEACPVRYQIDHVFSPLSKMKETLMKRSKILKAAGHRQCWLVCFVFCLFYSTRVT